MQKLDLSAFNARMTKPEGIHSAEEEQIIKEESDGFVDWSQNQNLTAINLQLSTSLCKEAVPRNILEEPSEDAFGVGTTFLSTNMGKLMQQPGKW